MESRSAVDWRQRGRDGLKKSTRKLLGDDRNVQYLDHGAGLMSLHTVKTH